MSDSSLQTESQHASTASFKAALIFNAIVFGAEMVAFTLVRPYFKSIYEPRTYAPPPSKRIQSLGKSLFLWPISVFKADHKDIIRTNGLDAYFFVRFLRMMVKILFPIWFVSWVVLLPITSVGVQGGSTGLDQFTFGNVGVQTERYAAHIILLYFFTGWIFYNIKTEMRHFITIRQRHLIETTHAKSAQAKTMLVTGIPSKYLNEEALRKLFGDLPGGVLKIWINRNLKELPDVYDRRVAAENKLEAAETQLLKTAANIRLADVKKGDGADVEASRETAAVIVPRDQRPQHRLGWIPFVGQKVDTIEWAREEIRVCTDLLEEGRALINGSKATEVGTATDGKAESSEGTDQEEEGKLAGMKKSYPPFNSAFVMFNKQIAAHLAMQSLLHHEPYRMSGKFVEVSPDDVIWPNLNMNPYEQKVRILISYAITAGLIILWAIPVAFVGAISNIYQLCSKVHWLAWICNLPTKVVGIIAGILPPVLLAVLMMLLPIVLRLLARFEGIPKRTGLELSLMTRFFIFQVIHSFLIVTLTSGLVAALPQLINNLSSIPSILAKYLPLASIFFLTYIILQGLAGTATGFLQIVPLIIYYVKLFILGSTPRAVYNIKYGLQNVSWGTLFPSVTLLVVITFAYSMIAPIINGLAFATFFLFYMLYKYLFLWVYEQPSTQDTGGLFFPKAIQHMFVGLYIQQICLFALFFLSRGGHGHPSAAPEGILTVVLIVITAFFQLIINNSYDPLINALPLSLANETHSYSDADVIAASPTDESDPLAPEREPRTSDISVEPRDNTEGETSHLIRREEVVEDDAFTHPAIGKPQRTVWLPNDALGLAKMEEEGCREVGIPADTKNAVMDEKGRVDVTGVPPDENDV